MKQTPQVTTQTVGSQSAELLHDVEDDLLHVQRAPLGHVGSRRVIPPEGRLHQPDQAADVLQARGSNPQLMVTGSDDPVTDGATLGPGSASDITLSCDPDR